VGKHVGWTSSEKGRREGEGGEEQLGLLLFCSTPHTPHNSTHTHHIYTECYSPLPCRLELTQERGSSGARARCRLGCCLATFLLHAQPPSSSCSWHTRSPPTHDAYTGRLTFYFFWLLGCLARAWSRQERGTLWFFRPRVSASSSSSSCSACG